MYSKNKIVSRTYRLKRIDFRITSVHSVMELSDDDSSCEEFHGNNIDTVITGALSEERCSATCSPPNWVPGEECVICMEEMVTAGEVSQLPVCNHFFHQKCITKWFVTKLQNRQAGRCPICNLEIVWSVHGVQPETVAPPTLIEHGNRNMRKSLMCLIAWSFFIFILGIVILSILKWEHIV